METKKWYQSLTIWFNIILIVLEAINQMAQFIPIPPGIISIVGNLLNIGLRFKTTNSISI